MKQSKAFLSGLHQVIPQAWLKLFDENELLLLICGTETQLNVDDMAAHVVYEGGYNAQSPTIQLFWQVIKSMTPQEQKQLLKFITSSSRPPLLGFKYLHPPICIRKSNDTQRLPSSSTCINLLKLPAYTTKQVLKQKLMTAIQEAQTFELT
jgi:hypothetical protein